MARTIEITDEQAAALDRGHEIHVVPEPKKSIHDAIAQCDRVRDLLFEAADRTNSGFQASRVEAFDLLRRTPVFVQKMSAAVDDALQEIINKTPGWFAGKSGHARQAAQDDQEIPAPHTETLDEWRVWDQRDETSEPHTETYSEFDVRTKAEELPCAECGKNIEPGDEIFIDPQKGRTAGENMPWAEPFHPGCAPNEPEEQREEEGRTYATFVSSHPGDVFATHDAEGNATELDLSTFDNQRVEILGYGTVPGPNNAGTRLYEVVAPNGTSFEAWDDELSAMQSEPEEQGAERTYLGHEPPDKLKQAWRDFQVGDGPDPATLTKLDEWRADVDREVAEYGRPEERGVPHIWDLNRDDDDPDLDHVGMSEEQANKLLASGDIYLQTIVRQYGVLPTADLSRIDNELDL